MLASSRTLLFTFVFALTLLISFAPQAADASANAAAVVAPIHRRHANRMIKKRQLGEVIGVGEDPNSASAPATLTTGTPTVSGPGNTATTTGGAATTTTSDRTTTTSSTSTSSSSSTASTSFTTSSSSSSTSSSTSSSLTSSSSSTFSSSSSSSTSRTESTSSTASSTSATLAVTTAPDVAQTSSSDRPTSTITNTVSQAQSSATQSANATGASSSSVSKTTITVIAVIGGCIGGAVVIWTIIRKWKFRPSAEFEDRMQPIDWNPDSTHAESGLNRTVSNASSFHSGSNHDDSLTGPRAYNPHGNAGLVTDLPNHDFTAGPAQLGGGYADLQRGPSPGPQMSSVARGPSFNRGYGY